MSHLPDAALHNFKRGEALTASALNANFTALLSLLDIAMGVALTPDPAARALEPRIEAIEQQLAAITRMLSMHSRQRNEMEWAPMAYVAAIMQLVQSLTGPISDRATELLAAHAEMQGQHHALATRIARLEQQPEAALAEDHAALAAAHSELAEMAKMTLGQTIALRHEVIHLTKMAMGHARERNEMQWTPLATAGHLLQRIMEVEKRLGSEVQQ